MRCCPTDGYPFCVDSEVDAGRAHRTRLTVIGAELAVFRPSSLSIVFFHFGSIYGGLGLRYPGSKCRWRLTTDMHSIAHGIKVCDIHLP